MPGCTTITGQLDKSDALMNYAVQQMGLYLEKNYKANINKSEFENLIKIAKKEYRKVSDEALNIGSITHDMIEQYVNAKINNDSFDPSEYKKYPDQVENAFLAFLEWEQKNIEYYIEAEKPVCSLWYYYAGTLDCVAKMKNSGIYVIDFKTASGFFDGYGEQIAAYKFAREEAKGKLTYKFTSNEKTWEKSIVQEKIKIDGVGILRLDKKTGLPEWKDFSRNYDQKLRSFLKLLSFYYSQKKRQLKNNPRIWEGAK